MTLLWDDLIGHAHEPGERDCFTLLRGFYQQNFDIEISNYARPSDWSSDELDLIRLLHDREGFEMISSWRAKDLRPGDLLCMAIGAGNPNHFGVYVGDNQFVHHLYNRRSVVEPYRDFWRNMTGYLLRHNLVPDLRPIHPDTDLRTLLRDRSAIATATDA